MTGSRPLLIVTLTARGVQAAREQAQEAHEAGADLAEVRFDRWEDTGRTHAAELFPSPIPIVATYRSRAEGGEGEDDAFKRRAVLEDLARHPFRFLDREIARDGTGPPQRGSGPTPILSRHFLEGVALEEVERALLTEPAGAQFVKVVVPSSVADAVGRLRSALPSEGVERIVFHTTGPSGPLYRAWAWPLGFSAVFCSLPEVKGRTSVEPSQLPVDHLRHYLGGATPGPLFAVVGHPVAHTGSPALFHRWMRSRGDRGLYMALDIASEAELAEVVPSLAGAGFRGLNVTRPWKQAALELASRIGPGAGPCGCANVLTFTPGGGIEAENTDLAALLRRFHELTSSSEWDGERITVVGSAGAARAALAAARVLGVHAIVVARDGASARRVAAEFDAHAVDQPPPRVPELLVNTTPIGRAEAGAPGLDFAPWVTRGGRVLDLVYAPDEPLLRRTAERRGAQYEDGWRLLVYQAAESYALWWGSPPSDSEVSAAVAGAS